MSIVPGFHPVQSLKLFTSVDGMNADFESQPHVVIVGGGFAGIAAARGLRKSNVRVTLIDRNPYSTFQPLLYQVATSTLNPGDVTYFLRAVRRGQDNLRVELGSVESMDHTEQTITLDDGRFAALRLPGHWHRCLRQLLWNPRC